MSDATKTSVGKPKIGGAISIAPLGTPLPTSATEELDSAFKNMGYISTDGLSNTNTPESDVIKAWGGDTVIVLQKSKDDTFKFKLMEVMNEDVLKYVYGDDNVSGSLEENNLSIKANSQEMKERSLVIDMILRSEYLKRIVIPNGKVSEVEEIVYKDDDAIGYGTTLKCVPDVNENTHYEYIQKAPAPAPTPTPTTYTVTFNTDGGSAVDPQTIEENGKVTKPADPTKDSATFDGWYKEDTFTTAWDFDNDVITEDTTIYAKWA